MHSRCCCVGSAETVPNIRSGKAYLSAVAASLRPETTSHLRNPDNGAEVATPSFKPKQCLASIFHATEQACLSCVNADVLIGTILVSKASSEEVQIMIRTLKLQVVFLELDQDRAEQLILGRCDTDELEQDHMEEQGFFNARPAALHPSIAAWLRLLPSFAHIGKPVSCPSVLHVQHKLSSAGLMQAAASGGGFNIAEALTVYSLAGERAS